MNIELTGEGWHVSINLSENQIEIRSEEINVKGKIELTELTIDDFEFELQKCINCPSDGFGKSILVSKDKAFGVEIRFDGDSPTVLLLGEYRESIDSEIYYEFEFISTKDVLINAIDSIIEYRQKKHP